MRGFVGVFGSQRGAERIPEVGGRLIGVFALGFTQLAVPLTPTCTLYVTPDVLMLAITNNKGRATLDIPIPPAVTGSFFAQGAMLDGSPLGLALTNGVSPTAN